MKKQGFLITECSHDLELNESAEGKGTYVTGIFSSYDRRNNNGRVYEEGTMKREVDKVLEKISNQSLWGELGHPPNPEINPDKIAIRVESLEWQGKDLYGKAKILNTPQGLIAQELVKEGRMGISSRGLGTVSESGTVNEDYNLITWDLVTDPSNGPSWMKGIYESAFTYNVVGKDVEVEVEVIAEEKQISIEEAKELHYQYIMKNIKEIEKNM